MKKTLLVVAFVSVLSFGSPVSTFAYGGSLAVPAVTTSGGGYDRCADQFKPVTDFCAKRQAREQQITLLKRLVAVLQQILAFYGV